MIKLDSANDHIRFKDGTDIWIDNSFEPEKHAIVTGEVTGLPTRLNWSRMEWETDMELQLQDRVVFYYLSVLNCFRKEMFKAYTEGIDQYIFIEYQNIFACIRNNNIIPVNGYCLIEPMNDPYWEKTKKRYTRLGLEPVRLNDKTLTDVVYGRVRYCGTPNRSYRNPVSSDHGVDIAAGDLVVMKKISDIPVEYDLHAKIDGGKRYWRVQRRSILAVINEESI